jgi:hypothetical protein
MYPAAGHATVSTASTEFSTGTLFGFSQISELNGSISAESTFGYSGSTAALATYDGTGENGYARGVWNVQWEENESVWYGAAYYLPTGFLANVQGQVDLMRWDNWTLYPNPDETDWGGIGIYGSDHKARLLRFGHGLPDQTLVGPFSLPEGQWFTLMVHQVRSDVAGTALSEVFLDGNLIGSSTAPNTYGRPATRVRFGIVAIAEGVQKKPLSLYFDNPSIGPQDPETGSGGPLPEAPAPSGPESPEGESGETPAPPPVVSEPTPSPPTEPTLPIAPPAAPPKSAPPTGTAPHPSSGSSSDPGSTTPVAVSSPSGRKGSSGAAKCSKVGKAHPVSGSSGRRHAARRAWLRLVSRRQVSCRTA